MNSKKMLPTNSIVKNINSKFEKEYGNTKIKKFIEKIFYRAPKELLLEKDLPELISITNFFIENINKFKNKNSKPKIISKTDGSITKIIISQIDRPFIIRTIQEDLIKKHIKTKYFLHPIIENNNINISLVYLEIENYPKKEIDGLINSLQGKLEILEKVTNDYPEISAELLKLRDNLKESSKNELSKEIVDLLIWLKKGSFIFLGYQQFKYQNKRFHIEKKLGLSCEEIDDSEVINKLIKEKIKKLVLSSKDYRVSKLNKISPIKSFKPITLISLIDSSQKNHKVIHSFYGIFTNKAFQQSSSTIPIIRKKVRDLINSENIAKNSFEHKNAISIIDSMPVSEAFISSSRDLKEIVTSVLSIQNENDTRVTLRHDEITKSISFLIFIPRDRFNSKVRDSIQKYLEKICMAKTDAGEYHLSLSNKPHAKLFFDISQGKNLTSLPNLREIEKEIAELSKSWEETLKDILEEKQWNKNKITKYENVFPNEYTAAISPNLTLNDILEIEKINESNPITFQMLNLENGEQVLSLYSFNNKLTLYNTLPKLENCGFKVISEDNWQLNIENNLIYIQKFKILTINSKLICKTHFEETIKPGLVKLFGTGFWNDSLNVLLVSSSLNIREIAVLRVYTKILWQIIRFTTRKHVFEYLASEPEASEIIYKYFDLKFNPHLKLTSKNRKANLSKLEKVFKQKLTLISDITKDRVFRSIFHLINCSIRTNYYKSKKAKAISIKLHSSNVEFMKQPRPMYEIFVLSTTFEGVHLRSSKIARGGLRWSERPDDYRTEVLDLMNTQRFKNSLIIPSGSKGGFALNLESSLANYGRDELFNIVKNTYKIFIRALLDITDNRVGNKIVSPTECIIYDDEDPYFVVAADKGTATFSDTANEIATNEYNFWLGDAFASGGSQGYDHKKSGITARGAWECTKRHFNELKLNYKETPFTVVGLGDMSGDVFGNGLLASKNMLLVAAFNHKHIFIDPTPNKDLSYKERLRLFKLKGSNWSDYDFKIVSKGGGVFDRFAKEVKLNKEINEALGIPLEIKTLSGNDLIKMILRAPVDLLWNGGIGTYVKASYESHSDAKDSSNDDVRVNGIELRAKVTAEGGNLGFTQNARIEYSETGGHINTDAIDNSAGVDLSDHEVNLKILLDLAIKANKISVKDRNKLLVKVEDSVIKKVLDHNKNHALLLSLGVVRSKRNIEYFRSLLKELNSKAYINRSAQNLPNDDELIERTVKKIGLNRPELAICIAGVKNYLKDVIVNSKLIQDQALERYLINYFPEVFIKKFNKEILKHPLAENIIASEVTNITIDNMGISYVHRMCINKSTTPEIAVKCAIASQIIVNLPEIEKNIEKFDNVNNPSLYIELRKYTNRLLREITSWLITYHGTEKSIQKIVTLYSKNFNIILNATDSVFHGEIKTDYLKRLELYSKYKIDKKIARILATGPIIVHIFESLSTANKCKLNVKNVAHLYTVVISSLRILEILRLETNRFAVNKWENELIINTFEEIKRNLSKLTLELINNKCTTEKAVIERLEKSLSYQPLKDSLIEIIAKPTPAALSVIGKQLRMFKI